MNKGAAAACYVPVPALAWLLARAAPRDRLVRHHARQGGWLVVAAWVLLLLLGLIMTAPASGAIVAPVTGTVVGLAIAGLLVGAISASRGRFVRIRPVWDLVAAFSASRSQRSRPA